MMNKEIYEAPLIEKVTVYLEQAIAGSTIVKPGDQTVDAFVEVWENEDITADIEIIL